MVNVTPEDFYKVATTLCEASKTIESKLRDLDNTLDVSRSAGAYTTGGPVWATSFDQSASDVFELGSTTSMSARELGYQVHQAGLNWAHAENESGGGDQPTPAAPQGSTLSTNLHPADHAVGGTHEKPDHWDLIADHVTKEWADCKEGQIGTAGTSFTSFGGARKTDAVSLWTDVTTVFTQAAQDQSPEVSGIIDEVGHVCRALDATGDGANALGAACAEVHRVADADKSTGRTSLTILNAILISYEIDKVATYGIPIYGGLLRAGIDKMIELNKVLYAQAMDSLMEGISGAVDMAAKSNTAIYTLATTSAEPLSSILDRTPRQTNPVRNRDETQNKQAGDEGERRAGIPEGAPKQEVEVKLDGKPVAVVPDLIDTENQNVVEVKNTNEIRPYTQQIRAEAEYAQQQGYTMTLVVDHRTQINDPQIQQMIDSGQIQLVRKELDDNNDL
ncbi:putative toxin [Mycolicibacterium sediminis]|uniref:Tox-REase-7 domain-containing protein n=1 Tax=Mycolicibacterium sediminis TaxID=1286180 RepID=A0A7I7QLH6_9MYCO|nr:putative toxin [Mycolicibacterium sediminis]BBY27122.1 hypothetical protein MSEDJ_12180 [Mycolicibacterium sediminis]